MKNSRFIRCKKVDSLGSGVVDGIFGRKIDGIRSLIGKLLKLLVNFVSLAFFWALLKLLDIRYLTMHLTSKQINQPKVKVEDITCNSEFINFPWRKWRIL